MATRSNKYDNFRQEQDKFLCLICNKSLSSKQRILIHLHKQHGMTPVKREKKRYLEDELTSVPRSTLYRWKKQKGAQRSLEYTHNVECNTEETSDHNDKRILCSSSEAVQDGKRLNLNDETLQYSHDCSQPINTESHEKNFQSDCSHSSQNMFQDEISTGSSLDESLKSDNQNDIDSNNINQYELVDDCDDWSLSSTNSLGSIDEESFNSSFHSEETSDSIHSDESFFHSDNETETDIEENFTVLNETESNDFGVPERELGALSLVSCFLRNKFSASTTRDVINTFKSTFPSCEELSDMDFGKILSNIEDVSLKEFHYCIICNHVFPSNVDVFRCSTTNCEGLRYKGPLSSQQKKGRQPLQCFLFTDIKEQLTDLLQTPGIWNDIQFNKEASYERKDNGLEELTDITDGASYRAMMGDGLFLDRTKNNLTAIFNTDGVSLYSSSKIELWPIFLAINELSPTLRFARENILLMGLWQGKGKPPFQAFLKIFTEELNTIYNDGVDVTIEEETYTVKLSVLCCITDLPAKAETLNMSYFNGEYACITCTEPGMTVTQGKGHAKCFPYRNAESRYSRRSDESIILNMNEGSNTKRSKGFKGTSALVNLQSYSIVDGSVPDYMHGVLLGITKSLLSKWFSPSESKKKHFIGKHIKVISKRMKSIKPPANIERLPRDLEKHYQHFKATELQTWLLYYSIPCVRGFLDEEYMENLVCLAEAIYILLGDSITPTSLEQAVDLLNQFYASFQRLYGDGSCGLNIHNTSLHLTEYVKLWGPIWCWSCFPFEDANAMLLQAVHGTGSVLKQVMKYRQAILNIRKKGLDLKKTTSWRVTVEATNCDVAGATKKLGDSENWVKEQIALLQPKTCIKTVSKIDRIMINNKKYCSEGYSRMQKRICNIVRYSGDKIGAVKYFVLCENFVYAVLKNMEIIHSSQIPGAPVVSHLIPVKFSETIELVMVDVEELCEVLVFIDTRIQANSIDPYYVCRLPNKYGHAVFK